MLKQILKLELNLAVVQIAGKKNILPTKRCGGIEQ